MRIRLDERSIDFRGTKDGRVERAARLADGRAYSHRCSREIFERVVAYLAEHPDDGLTMAVIGNAVDAPFTQVNVALQLLIDRGLLVVEGRKSYVDDGYRPAFYEHAMTEFLALTEGHAVAS